MNCRSCGSEIRTLLVNLGSAPPSNAYLMRQEIDQPEIWYPLRVYVCEKCWLVQTQDFAKAEQLFSEHYAYFSGFSYSWREHCEKYFENISQQIKLDPSSLVVEVASNDGTLLYYFHKNRIRCVGIEPTKSTAEASREKGIDVIEDFFGKEFSEKFISEYGLADLVIGNNVLAHVPDINDFVSGIENILKLEGVVTFEFPHLLNLISKYQLDTIYHEHYSYLSLFTIKKIFNNHNLEIYKVEKIQTHGGSLRVYAQKKMSRTKIIEASVNLIIEEEMAAGISEIKAYEDFQNKTEKIKNDFLLFLIEAKKKGKVVAGYGAAAKASTLINYSGVRADLISFIADLNPYKQGKYMPGSQIPIVSPDYLRKNPPDYLVIFPWNIANEIKKQNEDLIVHGTRLMIAIPELQEI